MRAIKAVSPVVATVLLILIAIATGAILWVWVNEFVSRSLTRHVSFEESLIVEAVKLIRISGGFYNISVYVRNIGSVEATIVAVYILDTYGNLVDLNTSLRIVLPPGKLTCSETYGCITLNNVKLNSGYAYVLRVVSSRGFRSDYLFTAS